MTEEDARALEIETSIDAFKVWATFFIATTFGEILVEDVSYRLILGSAVTAIAVALIFYLWMRLRHRRFSVGRGALVIAGSLIAIDALVAFTL